MFMLIISNDKYCFALSWYPWTGAEMLNQKTVPANCEEYILSSVFKDAVFNF